MKKKKKKKKEKNGTDSRKKKSWVSNPQPFALEANALLTELQWLFQRRPLSTYIFLTLKI